MAHSTQYSEIMLGIWRRKRVGRVRESLLWAGSIKSNQIIEKYGREILEEIESGESEEKGQSFPYRGAAFFDCKIQPNGLQ